MNTEKYIFLLGGYDLEMVEIRTFLKRKKATLIDRKLNWSNANWEVFQDLFNRKEYADKIFVGIELDKKEFQPKNSIDIDHHGKKEKEASALEQVLNLFGMAESMTTRRKLIVANDTGYIPAMEALGASKAEIAVVREKDRKAQGVTKQDEDLAQKAIENNKEVQGKLTVIYSETNRFSAIADRLYGKVDQLLIYAKDELTFYGSDRSMVEDLYPEDKDKSRMYKGGGESGYLGFKRGEWETDEIKAARDCVIQLFKPKEKIYSHHVFLFPFKWDPKAFSNNEGNKSTKPMESFEVFKKFIQSAGKWKHSTFNLEKQENSGLDHFNEINYFYSHVREALYDLGTDLITDSHAVSFMDHFEYQLGNDQKHFNILLKDGAVDASELLNLSATYSLEIDSIILNVYRTNTAVISFHLRNKEYSHPEDILKINKFGRRISVPFFDLKPDSIYSGSPDQSHQAKNHDILGGTKYAEIPNALWIGQRELNKKSLNESIPFYEDFSSYRVAKNYEQRPFILPAFIKDLFAGKEEGAGVVSHLIEPLFDDRMHVISWYGNSVLINNITKIRAENRYAFEQSDWWYKYVYTDTTVMQTDRFKRQEMLQNQTYSRFVEWGTLFGVSRYSFVMLTNSFSDLEKFNATYVVRHLQSMYYKMVELCLLQRATILHFSDEVAELSTQVYRLNATEKQGTVDEIVKRIRTLYRNYLFFVNQIYFREVTPQEQGIELYDLLQQTMRLPEEVKNLDNEIHELNAFVQSVNEERKAKESHNFTMMAAFFLGPTFLAGVLGMNTVPLEWAETFSTMDFLMSFFWVFGIGSSIGIMLLWAFRRQNKKNKK